MTERRGGEARLGSERGVQFEVFSVVLEPEGIVRERVGFRFVGTLSTTALMNCCTGAMAVDLVNRAGLSLSRWSNVRSTAFCANLDPPVEHGPLGEDHFAALEGSTPSAGSAACPAGESSAPGTRGRGQSPPAAGRSQDPDRPRLGRRAPAGPYRPASTNPPNRRSWSARTRIGFRPEAAARAPASLRRTRRKSRDQPAAHTAR